MSVELTGRPNPPLREGVVACLYTESLRFPFQLRGTIFQTPGPLHSAEVVRWASIIHPSTTRTKKEKDWLSNHLAIPPPAEGAMLVASLLLCCLSVATLSGDLPDSFWVRHGSPGMIRYSPPRCVLSG